MSRAAPRFADFAPDHDEPTFPLVVVRAGCEGALAPPPPSSRTRRRVPTCPGLGAIASAPPHASEPDTFGEVDELIALSEPAEDSFYYPPEDSG